MIADVVFDAPVTHPFSYRVPAGDVVAPGQRVVAPLRGAGRVGMVLAVRAGEGEGLRALTRVADCSPMLDASGVSLVQWIADESLSSLGSTAAALLPPPSGRENGSARGDHSGPLTVATDHTSPVEVLMGAGRERRLLERAEADGAPLLVVTADVEAAARWAQRLARLGPTVRLDSGASDDARAAAWTRLAAGDVRLGVGTRSALLVPVPAGSTLALIDEQEAAHRPPGHPRIHSREVVLERARRSGLRVCLTAATPSLEVWWRAQQGRATISRPGPGPAPPVTIADTRGILRREALTPALSRALRECLAAGQRALLVVSRLASALACDECGMIMRCPECRVALAYGRAARRLVCRVCGTEAALPEICPGCAGRRLSPFGWGAERVEHAVRRRFPRAQVVRYDPEATGVARGEAQRTAAAGADVIVGTRGALRLFGPSSLGLTGFVSPDQLLRLPDFRASERLFALAWAAVERVRADGAVVIQSQSPAHHVFAAVARREPETFYQPELEFRQEAGYPPLRRLAVITVRAREATASRTLADDVVGALRAARGLTVYPATADRTERLRRIVVKGSEDLPRRIGPALADFRTPRPRRHGIIEVEVDPVEWPF
jgi:primosomal protein N' (replication factor Y) (superfamily II helicase)